MFAFVYRDFGLIKNEKKEISQFGCSLVRAIKRFVFKNVFASLQVLPGLYVGNYRDSKDVNQLSKHNITHILAIHDTARKLHPVSVKVSGSK